MVFFLLRLKIQAGEGEQVEPSVKIEIVRVIQESHEAFGTISVPKRRAAVNELRFNCGIRCDSLLDGCTDGLISSKIHCRIHPAEPI
jgi:hypothetical protein